MKSSQSLSLGAKGLNTICIIIQNWMIHFKTIFRQILVFIAINIIQNIVFYGNEVTDFIHNLCQTKLNDWLGLFYMNSCNWGLICMKFSRKEK